MKKSILSVGIALNKAEQRSINGGGDRCDVYPPWPGQKCGLDQDCETEFQYEIG